MNHFISIGHRGACGYMPENTLGSFDLAMKFGVDMIELDVHCCKSGEIVVIHDETIDRTTSGTGLVSEKTLTELKKLDDGIIPTLEEVFDLVNKKTIINIELKGKNTATPTARLIKRYVDEKEWSFDHFQVSSFDHVELMKFKRFSSDVKTGALYGGDVSPFEKNNTQHSFIAVSKEWLTPSYINLAHSQGLKIYVYTVNELDDIKLMRELGVDGIFSNYPDRV